MDPTLLVPESWSNTAHNLTRFVHKWTIENFDYYIDADNRDYQEERDSKEQIISPKFSPPNNEKLVFSLVLHPKGDCQQNKDHVSLFLHLHLCKMDELKVRYKMSILDGNKTKQNIVGSLDKFTQSTLEPGTQSRYPTFIEHKKLRETANLIPDNKLTIYCEIEAMMDSIETCGTNEVVKEAETQLANDLGRLLENQLFTSDVALVSNNRIVIKTISDNRCSYKQNNRQHAHKAILAARSTIFANMFKNEPNGKEIQLNYDYRTIGEMLKYIYTGKVQYLDMRAEKLLGPANEYELGQLKYMCEQSLITKLNPENVVKMLVLADQHKVKQLRSKAIEYINGNLSSIMQTQNWKTIKDKPELYFELFSKILAEKIEK